MPAFRRGAFRNSIWMFMLGGISVTDALGQGAGFGTTPVKR
jgi:hypothetical protein